jgi:hypothetical protein
MAVFTMMDSNLADVTIQRNAAAAVGFGLIGTSGSLSGMRAIDAQRTVDSLMRNAATASGRGQVANLPIVPIGFSGGGSDAQSVAQGVPSRTITYMSNRRAGDVEPDAQVGWTNLSGLYLPGAIDTNSGARPSFTYSSVMKGGPNNGYTYYPAGYSVREKGGLATMGVLLGRGHSNDATNNPASPGYEFGWYWIARNAAARLPASAASTTPGNPVALNALSKTAGWLGEVDQYVTPPNYGFGNTAQDTPGGTSPFKPIAAYADYTGDKEAASWMVDRDLAFAYRAAMSNDRSSAPRFDSATNAPLNTPLVFTGLTALQSLSQGDLANLSINPRDFASTGSITQMAFYDGATLLGTDTVASDGWGISVPLTEAGIRGLSVIATRSDGQVRTSFRAVSVQAAAVPEPSSLGLLALAAGALLRRVRAVR